MDQQVTNFFSIDVENQKFLEKKGEKSAGGSKPNQDRNFKEDIELIDEEGLPQENFEHIEDDQKIEDSENFEPFEEDPYSSDDEGEVSEINFDDPFDSLEDLDDEDEDDEGSLF